MEFRNLLTRTTKTENVRDAFQCNYLALAKALQAQWKGLDPQDPKKAEVKEQFDQSLEKLGQFGAESELLQALRDLILGS